MKGVLVVVDEEKEFEGGAVGVEAIDMACLGVILPPLV